MERCFCLTDRALNCLSRSGSDINQFHCLTRTGRKAIFQTRKKKGGGYNGDSWSAAEGGRTRLLHGRCGTDLGKKNPPFPIPAVVETDKGINAHRLDLKESTDLRGRCGSNSARIRLGGQTR